MRRRYPLLTLALAACGRPVYTRTAVGYAEPPRYVYVAPIDRVVVRGLTEVRDREHGRRWARRARAEEVITQLDGRMRRAH
jgi:hypothetical protein